MKRTYNTANEAGTRRSNIQGRIISFVSKIEDINKSYLPRPSLRRSDMAAHSKALAVWRKKVQDACLSLIHI